MRRCQVGFLGPPGANNASRCCEIPLQARLCILKQRFHVPRGWASIMCGVQLECALKDAVGHGRWYKPEQGKRWR